MSTEVDDTATNVDGQPGWMAEGFSRRLRLAMKGRTAAQLAADLGVSRSGFAKNLAGTIPRADVLFQLARVLEVDAEWLLCGTDSETPLPYDRLMLPGAEELLQHHQPGVHARSDGTVKSISKAMLLGALRRTSTVGLYLVEATTDAMTPTIRHGANTIVDAYDTTLADGVFALGVHGAVQLRRLQLRFTGDVTVSADNPHFTDHRLSPTEARSLNVLGRVVWVGQSL